MTGGYVVRDPEVPSLAGRYLYGDYCAGALHAVKREDGKIVENRSLGLVVPRLTTFGEDGAATCTSRRSAAACGVCAPIPSRAS